MRRVALENRAQKDKFGSGKHGFTSGNPSTGVLATIPGDDWFDIPVSMGRRTNDPFNLTCIVKQACNNAISSFGAFDYNDASFAPNRTDLLKPGHHIRFILIGDVWP